MRAALFGIVALLPAALNSGAGSARTSMIAPLCSAEAGPQMVRIPLQNEPALPGEGGCCVKGCHAGGSRKRKDCDL